MLERLTGELCETLAREERRGRTIGIKVRFDDFSTVTRARSLDAPVNDDEDRRRRSRSSCSGASIRAARCGSWGSAWRAWTRRLARAVPDDQLSLSL